MNILLTIKLYEPVIFLG